MARNKSFVRRLQFRRTNKWVIQQGNSTDHIIHGRTVSFIGSAALISDYKTNAINGHK